MFIPHCHGFGFFGSHSLVDSLQLLAAFSVECELQDARQRAELERFEKDLRPEHYEPKPHESKP